MSKTVILFIGTFLISGVICSPTTTLTKSVGDKTVWMLCQIKELTNQVVTWTFLTHNKLISKGDKLQVDDQNHYQIEILQGDSPDAPASYILKVVNLVTADQGLYQCAVMDTNVSLSFQLNINEAPPVPTPSPSHDYNFTDCCVEKNVSTSCRPVCDPFHGLPTTFDPVAKCALDLPKLLKCGSDGKNHVPCCKRRGLPDVCLDFCLGVIPPSLDTEHLQCLNRSLEIIMCYEEGINILPGPPTAVSAISQASPLGFVVSWKEPVDNPNLVKGYYIHYKSSAENTYHTSISISKDSRSFPINGLMANKIYAIYMSAFSDYGSSQPSEIITQPTIGGTPPVEQDLNIKDCCDKTSMPQKCKDSLCRSSVFENLDPTVVLSCYGYLDEALKCVSGHRNHTGCCQRNGIPTTCLGFCSGDVPPLTADLSQCMIRLPMIEACIQEGLETLPGPPQNIRLTEVKQTTATLQWMAPTNGTVKEYVVSYLEHSREGLAKPNMTTTSNTTLQLKGLTPNTEYDVTVISQNDAGQSLPSAEIGFLTYAVPPSLAPVTPSPGPVVPYDLGACCQQKGLKQDCMPLCDYGFIVNASVSDLFNKAIPCLNDFGKVISCGSDGRDHTQCCSERGVNPNCYQLCRGSFDGADTLCALEAPKIALCFKEGILDLPRPPSSVYLNMVTHHSISISWFPPYGGPPVDYYYVVCAGCDKVPVKEKSTGTSYILQNLMSDRLYNISVVSANSEGYSIPSSQFSVYLISDHILNCTDNFTVSVNKSLDTSFVSKTVQSKNTSIDQCKKLCREFKQDGQCTGFLYNTSSSDCMLIIGMYGQKLTLIGTDFYARGCDFETPDVPKINGSVDPSWKTQQECCLHHNVSDVCMPFCQTGNAFSDPQKCEDEFSTVVSCSSDGKDHTPCCLQAGVPDTCLPICKGAVMDKDHPFTQLCLSYTRLFVTCFSQGTRTIPSMPQRFRETKVGTTFIELAWDKPDQNCDSQACQYDIMFTTDKTVNTIYNWTSTTRNLTNLQPNTVYYISVSATNMYGSSLPSQKAIVRTLPVSTFEVNFYIMPKMVIETGKAVTLICEVFGAPDAVVSIKFKSKEISKEKVYSIQSATKKDSGQYTCTVQQSLSSTNITSKLVQVMVRYAPAVINTIGDTVESGTGQTAYLKCNFEGLPMQVKWTKGGSSLPTGVSISSVTTFNADGTLTDSLVIYNVRDSMFGRYECNGTNEYGYAVGQVELKVDYKIPTVIPPTVPPANSNITACCLQGGVTGVCLELCNLDVDYAKVLIAKYDSCVQLLPVFAVCAADKKDHTKCCDSRGVKEYCQPFCMGNTPNMSDIVSLLSCMADAVDILECAESGRVKIPYAPTNVRAVQNEDKIRVSWDPPKSGTATVERYDIIYYTSFNSKLQNITVEKTLVYTDIPISSEKDGTQFYISVRAGNSYGDSLPEQAKLLVVSDVPPSAPQQLSGKVDGTNLNLQWIAPSYIGNIAAYVVKYKISGENSIPKDWIVLDTKKLMASLTGLTPNKMYEVYVVGRNGKMVEGKSSNVITISTGNTGSITDSNRQSGGSGGTNGGVVAVIVILILVLIGAVAAGIIYFRQRNRHRFSEAVTFENPQYGSHDSQIKISGLPTDSSEDNPFGYSPLQEERDEQYSSPMLSVDNVEFKPRK